jgi:hypothetical protein
VRIPFAALIALSCLSLLGTGASAQDQKDIDKPLIVLGGGVFDLGSKSRGEGRLEVRGGDPLFWRVKPTIGVNATAGGATYGFGGLLADFALGEGFVLTPSLAAGGYRQGSGKDLGHGIEFRSQIEAAYVMAGGARVGLGASHLSNAGLGDKNPGANSVFGFLAFPF